MDQFEADEYAKISSRSHDRSRKLLNKDGLFNSGIKIDEYQNQLSNFIIDVKIPTLAPVFESINVDKILVIDS